LLISLPQDLHSIIAEFVMVELDLTEPVAKLFGLFRNSETSVLEDFRELVTKLPCDLLAGFFSQLFKPAYIAVDGTPQHVAELRFVLPGRADELLAALRAYKADRDKVFTHDASPSFRASA
jgi:hypothetical protein